MPKHIAEGTTASQLTSSFISGTSGTIQQVISQQLTGTYISSSWSTGVSATFQAFTGTYVSSSWITGTNISGTSGTFHALFIEGMNLEGVYGGLYLDSGPASLGGVNDPTMTVASGVWTAISSSLTASRSSTNGHVSSTIQNGRVYVDSDGIYHVSCASTIEINANTMMHMGLFVTGVEYPRWSQAQDVTNGDSSQFSITALGYLTGGQYYDVRVRPAGGSTVTVHHFATDIHRLPS